MDTAIIAIIIAIVPIVFSVLLFLETRRLKNQIKKLTTGFSDQNLKEIVERYVLALQNCENDIKKMNEEFEQIRKETAGFLRKTGIIRFQAFKDTGGDQSFSLAVLDQNNDGFVLSCLHGRGFSKIYAKEIQNGTCENYKLTDEENSALQKALQK